MSSIKLTSTTTDLSETQPRLQVNWKEFEWYALQIQSRLALVALDTLRGKGYDPFLPLYTTRRRWSDRVKVVEAPLFPGYMFCRFDTGNTLPILTTPGMIGILSTGNLPIPIAEEEIAAVRAILRSGLATQTHPFLAVGSKVYMNCGPLVGLEGILISAEKVDRLIVSVTLLHRSVAVEIDREWAVPVLHGARGMQTNGIPAGKVS